MEEVVLVDSKDREIGRMEKLEAHKKGVLHRAFSVLIFNSRHELLIQRRSEGKYHSGGLWTNTCCSHPRPEEPVHEAAKRRLMEEMGIDLQPEFLYKFIYKTELDNQLTEHELDHVFTGTFDGEPNINKDEVDDWKYVDLKTLKADIEANADHYTHWFKIIIENIAPHLKLKVA
ncbi:isopentenyl-diphosphate Delta-isomerase [Fulvivirga kasyanovii]|uniref:Isopentenyl-diphosphate delta-isomerase n=1 Tax=Fulvivirga kasyanovii TaxID=396812 RepID=A0ABW9RU58_9BACT|nr:isopentenyl-diphosphate Delta-isomerase [Fulvivirga kasyanovii]MTI27728.1 isopentenyl-diphosphate Delta-isomerase [Fulvivirga kasyanovii]